MVIGLLPDDEPGQLFEYAAQFQIVHHAFHRMGTLAYVLNEEYRTFCRNIVGRAAQSVEHGYVAAPEDARTLAFVIELMCRAGIAERGFFLQFIAEQDVFQGLGTKVVFRLHGEMPRHRSVQRSEAVLLEHIVQGGDITETDKPFGMSAELGKMRKEGILETDKNHFVLKTDLL